MLSEHYATYILHNPLFWYSLDERESIFGLLSALQSAIQHGLAQQISNDKAIILDSSCLLAISNCILNFLNFPSGIHDVVLSNAWLSSIGSSLLVQGVG